MDFLFWIAVITFIFVFLIGLEGVVGARRIAWLDAISPLADSALLPVSIIIPALNEEANIREALSSVLSLDYRPLEIIVINDRSTDGTGKILEEMASCNPRLKIIHLKKLPPGWLGKNHALHCGASKASGEYFLFTDADIVMEPSTLKRAMARMLACNLDHITLFFKALLPSSLLQMVVLECGVSLMGYFKPWKASDPAAKNFIGIGAFNLVRAAAYRKAGGHEAIRLCPVDDVMLGKLIKRHDFRQECLYGHRFIAVKWYGSLGEMIKGLMKNTYAALEYSFLRLCILTVLQFLISIWPLWAVVFTGGATRLVNLAIILIQVFFFIMASIYSGIDCKHIVWFPLTPYIRIYMTWKAVLTTIFHGGIIWRGTFYPLKELKEGRL